MGVHHFKLIMVPKERFRFPVTLTKNDIDRIEGEDGGWWASRQPAPQTLDRLRQLCPNNKSWGEIEEYVTSEPWGSDLRIWNEHGRVWAVVFRYSPTSGDISLLQRFVAIAREEQCLLLDTRTGALFEPNEDFVAEHLRDSRAMRFVHNPQSTITEAAKELRQQDDDDT